MENRDQSFLAAILVNVAVFGGLFAVIYPHWVNGSPPPPPLEVNKVASTEGCEIVRIKNYDKDYYGAPTLYVVKCADSVSVSYAIGGGKAKTDVLTITTPIK